MHRRAPWLRRPPVIDDLAVVVATLEAPPESLGVTHWSTRLLGTHLGISFASVARIWREHDLKPWKRETFKFSTDPELDAKVRDVVGLYLNPPEKAVVVCIDEKTQIQALDRTAPILPMRAGLPEKATHDYLRHGTTSLFAALEVATGTVTDACYQRHTHAEFLDFLKLVAKAYPRVRLHVVADNYATHKHPKVKNWLEVANDRRDRPPLPSQCVHADVVLPCEHERRGSFGLVLWSATTSVEGAPPSVAEPHGWGLSMSRSGDFHGSGTHFVIGRSRGWSCRVEDSRS